MCSRAYTAQTSREWLLEPLSGQYEGVFPAKHCLRLNGSFYHYTQLVLIFHAGCQHHSSHHRSLSFEPAILSSFFAATDDKMDTTQSSGDLSLLDEFMDRSQDGIDATSSTHVVNQPPSPPSSRRTPSHPRGTSATSYDLFKLGWSSRVDQGKTIFWCAKCSLL